MAKVDAATLVRNALTNKKSTKTIEKANKEVMREERKKFLKKFDKMQLLKGIEALLQHHNNNTKMDLLGNDSDVRLQISLIKAPTIEDSKVKPTRIELPHSFYKLQEDNDNGSKNLQSLQNASVCIFVKDDESKATIKELQENFPQSSEIQSIKKIIKLSSLRQKYSSFQQRNELVHSFDIFIVDDRIVPLMSSCLGKVFLKRKKQPIPVKINDELPVYLKKCLTSTFMFLSMGTCVSIKAGSTNMTKQNLKENCMAIVLEGIEKIPHQWNNIQGIHIKTSDSIALPIYSTIPSNETMKELLTREQKDEEADKELERYQPNKSKNKSLIVQALEDLKTKDSNNNRETRKRKEIEDSKEITWKKKNKKGNDQKLKDGEVKERDAEKKKQGKK